MNPPTLPKPLPHGKRQTGLSTKTVDPAAVIAKAAAEERRSHMPEGAMEIFVSAYGAEAGNLGLKLLPYGGLYVAGGIAGKKSSVDGIRPPLWRRFPTKAESVPLLDKVPVYVVLNPQVGLIGAALRAATT